MFHIYVENMRCYWNMILSFIFRRSWFVPSYHPGQFSWPGAPNARARSPWPKMIEAAVFGLDNLLLRDWCAHNKTAPYPAAACPQKCQMAKEVKCKVLIAHAACHSTSWQIRLSYFHYIERIMNIGEWNWNDLSSSGWSFVYNHSWCSSQFLITYAPILP